jgi:hypothetical protein
MRTSRRSSPTSRDRNPTTVMKVELCRRASGRWGAGPMAPSRRGPHPVPNVIGDGEGVVGQETLGGALCEEPEAPRGWFTRLVQSYLRHRRRPGELRREPGETQADASTRTIRSACIASSISGALSATAATTAAVFTAETGGIGSIVAVPIALGAVGLELFVRSLVHLHMTVGLADVFGIRLDPDDPHDLWELFAVVLEREPPREGAPNADRELVRRVLLVEDEDVGTELGSRLVVESVLRNVVPFAGIPISSVANWVQTKRLGDTVRRYMRYRRALDDAIGTFGRDGAPFLPMFVEGVWFLFVADGRLRPEETATLARLVRDLDPQTRARVAERFVEDELDWTERLAGVPEPVRDRFLSALEIAAAVDARISLPERKILRRAARALGRELDPAHLEELMHAFAEIGVVDRAPAAHAQAS